MEDCEWETLFYGNYRSVFYDVIGQQRNQTGWKIVKEGLLHRSKSFKVIEIGINQKTICDFLLVINSNWQLSRAVLELLQLVVQILDTFAFLSHPLGVLGTTYDVHLGLIEKHIVDFRLALIELFFTRYYCWSARGENRWKINDFASMRSVWPKISGRMGRPHQ